MSTTSVSGQIQSLTQSLTLAISTLPSTTDVQPPEDGISLLDVKNELFLSYLQNLVFLIILKLRNYGDTASGVGSDEEVVKNLVELRIYLEKGVKPLESRLRYQIDKVVTAAQEAEMKQKAQSSGNRGVGADAKFERSKRSKGSDEAGGEGEVEIDPLSYRPNPAALLPTSKSSGQIEANPRSRNGVYRPPRITPTALPASSRDSREQRQGRMPRSSALNEFIDTDLSTAPIAEPSIGSNIIARGRHSKSTKETADDAERAAYEEANFVRLPAESQTEKRKKEMQRGSRRGQWGGEEWSGLGQGADRIARALDSAKVNRKRVRDTADSPRGDGLAAGERFAAKKRLLDDRMKRRKRGV